MNKRGAEAHYNDSRQTDSRYRNDHHHRPDSRKAPEDQHYSTDELADQAEQHRERIGETLKQLDSRLSTDRLADDAVQLWDKHGTEFITGLQRSVAKNPLPLALTGIGIAWMIMNQRNDHEHGDHQHRENDPVKKQDRFKASPKYAGSLHQHDGIHDSRRIKRSGQNTAIKMQRVIREQPIIVGAFAVAAGALIGALLPTSKRE